jgi:hypothetical protein
MKYLLERFGMTKYLVLIPLIFLCCITIGCQQGEDVDGESTISLEQNLRSFYINRMNALNNRDVDTFLAGCNTRGFGYRTMGLRTANDPPQRSLKQIIEEWLETMKYFKVELKEFDVVIDGNIGLVWGYFVEDFQGVGKKPERNLVRFSETLRRTEGGHWETLISHRDIQPFDENGQYIPKYIETRVANP